MATSEDEWQELESQENQSSSTSARPENKSEEESSDSSKDGIEPAIGHTRQSSSTRSNFSILDWDKIHALCDQSDKERRAKLPAIVKKFYTEDPEVSSMSSKQVEEWRRANYDMQVSIIVSEQPDLKSIPNPVLTFEQAFKNYPDIIDEMYKLGLKKPSPIQSQAWPILLGGANLIGIAPSGTGKTLAYLLPAMIHIEGQITPREERQSPTVLILVPTRELAIQIHKEISKFQYKNIESICLCGGRDETEQINVVTQGIDIVVATPGRFKHFILKRYLHAINFTYIVLDEADRLLDTEFGTDVRISLYDVRPDNQTVMISSTWPPEVRNYAKLFIKNPIKISVGSLYTTSVHTITQQLLFLEDDDKMNILLAFIKKMSPNDKVIVFCGSKVTAIHVSTELSIKGINCELIYSGCEQEEREAAMEAMLNGTTNILIATDVASRGIDIHGVTHVINFDFPRQILDYTHRIGRTGRAGKPGTAITYMTKYDCEYAVDLIRILYQANQKVPIELEMMAQRYATMKYENLGRYYRNNSSHFHF